MRSATSQKSHLAPAVSSGDLRKIAKRNETLTGYAFLMPAILVLGFILLIPFVQACILSFYDKPIGGEASYVGLHNYVATLTDPKFATAVGNTVVFVVFSIAFKIVIGMSVALALTAEFPGRGLARVAVLIPWALPEISAILSWVWMLDGNVGALNSILRKLGLVTTNIYFLSDRDWALPTVTAINIWRGFPFFTLTLLAALQTVDGKLYEAAELDGANAWHKFWYITLPSIMPVLLVTTLLSTIWTTNSFTTIFVLTGGGPSDITTTVPIYTYDEAFKGYGNLGRAASVAVITLPFIIAMIVFLMRVMRKREEME